LNELLQKVARLLVVDDDVLHLGQLPASAVD
jgi:hypothetical protein